MPPTPSNTQTATIEPSRGRSRARLALFVGWLLSFYAAWISIVLMGDHWRSVIEHKGIAVAMAVGSYFAGSTPMGGGTVGFPVLVLLFGEPASMGRDFSLAIQSVGMISAALLIWCLRQPVEVRILKWATLGALVGTPLGLAFIAPAVPGLYAKLSFAVLWASFGSLHLAKAREISRMSGMTDMPASFDRVAGLLTGALAGMSVVALTGVGIDLAIYVVLVLVSRADTKIAVPTSVVLMAITSVIGFATQFALARAAPESYALSPGLLANWLAASPVVLIGAPVGVLVVRLVPRAYTLVLVSVLCLLQFGWTLWHERADLSPTLIGSCIVAFLTLNLIFMLMYNSGKRWERRRAHADAPPTG